jgi:sugar lactone lactonase YvrE
VVKREDANIPDVVELLKIGGEGNGGGRFKDNRHVAVDGRGRIYSSDYSPFRIQVFDAEGKFLNQWAAEKGTNLYDLAADREGNLYVANDKGVFKYKGETGELLHKLENMYPRGIALTWDGKVLVAMDKVLAILDSSLKPILEIKDWGERANSTFGFENIAADGSGIIYAIDRHDGAICKFSADGKFLNRFPAGLKAAKSIAIDPKGRIFVADASSVAVFDENGRKIKEFEAPQAFGMVFDQKGDLFITSRPWVIKKQLNF